MYASMLIAAILGGLFAFTNIAHINAVKTTPALQTTTEKRQPTVAITSTNAVTKPLTKSAENYSVPILMYHYIRTVTDKHDQLGYNLSVTPTHFEAQIKWLKDNNYAPYSLTDFCDKKVPESGKPIILTFDDGYDDAYTAALPILQKYNVPATFFIVSGFINKQSYLNTEHLKALSNAQMELGGHTIKHINLAAASVARQKEEIAGSKQAAPVFAYPSGQYSPDTIKITKEAGYKCAVTTHYAIATQSSPLYELPRVRITGNDTLEDFIKRVEGKK